jgi:UDP-2,3-diacylglucosamine pyrophosphatase LpxH
MMKISLYALGDFHCGLKNTNIDYIKEAVKIIKDDPNEKRVYLMGDLIEVADKKLADSVYHQILPLEDQIETVIALLKPIKEHIRCYCHGNHEDRLMKNYGLNTTKLISRSEGWDYAIQYFDKVQTDKKTFVVFAVHGLTYTKYPHNIAKLLIDNTRHIDADIILHGHMHYPLVYEQYVQTPKGTRKRLYVSTGHFIETMPDYALKKVMPPSPPSFVKLEVGDDVRGQIIKF